MTGRPWCIAACRSRAVEPRGSPSRPAWRARRERCPWLAEPGLLTARVRAAGGAATHFRMLRLEPAPLPESLQSRLEVARRPRTRARDRIRLWRRALDLRAVRVPGLDPRAASVAAELGESPLGEALRRVADTVREPLEYAELPADHELARAAARPRRGSLWARRAVYRLAGAPILVQEVFLPALVQYCRASSRPGSTHEVRIPSAVAPTVEVAGTDERFPVHRIYCVGRNYAAHAREMGMDPKREPPFFFTKPPTPFANGARSVSAAHHEPAPRDRTGRRARCGRSRHPGRRALDHVFGYAVGNDLTRRDLQLAARRRAGPGTPQGIRSLRAVTAIRRVAEGGHLTSGAIWLEVNGELRQRADLAEMIWSVPEIIAELSTLFELRPAT